MRPFTRAPSHVPLQVLLWTARVRAAACSSAFSSNDADIHDHLEQQVRDRSLQSINENM